MRSLILLALLVAPLSAAAANKPSVQTAIMTGIGSVVGTAVYSPIKVATAVSGLAIGLVISPLTDFALGTHFARDLIEASTCGDYTLTDAMLRGEERLCYWYVESCGPYE